jgi:hypothetical protein
MASLSMKGTGDAQEIANVLISGVQNSAMSCQLVDRISRSLDDFTYDLLVFEKYYMRSSNRASLSVCVIGRGAEVIVDAVGAGGGQGVLFRFSWGAEENFVNVVRQLLSPMGFH